MWSVSKLRGSILEVPGGTGATALSSKPTLTRPAGRASSIALNAAIALSLWFLSTSVLKYLTVTQDTYGIFWPRHEWLLAHIISGTIALLLGPIQMRIGWGRRQLKLHRILGIIYVLSVAVSSIAALQLAINTDFGWVFGMGLASMAGVWIITTGLATVAICRKMVQQHREWIIRSYVVTFGFVIFRLLITILEIAGIGTLSEQLIAASWFSWSIPLFLTEVVLQGRKVLGLERKDNTMWELPTADPSRDLKLTPIPFRIPESEVTDR